MITIAGAPEPPRRRLRRAKPKDAEPLGEPPTVPLTTLTAIHPEPLGELEAANRWLSELRGDEEATEELVEEALRLINRAVHAHRTAALDPHVPDISAPHALAVRIGFGDGEGLADGRWEEAIELPGAGRRGRLEALAPQERVAAILSGRESVDAATTALLRARVDLDGERDRDAALQLRVGLEALLADRANFASSGQAEDLASLGERRKITGEGANAALSGPLSASQVEELETTLKLCERVLRRRRAYG